MNEDEKSNVIPEDLVVVGSSAGGVEALSIFVGTLPSDKTGITYCRHFALSSTCDCPIATNTTIKLAQEKRGCIDGLLDKEGGVSWCVFPMREVENSSTYLTFYTIQQHQKVTEFQFNKKNSWNSRK